MKNHFKRVIDVFDRNNSGIIMVQDGFISDGVMIIECDHVKAFEMLTINFEGFGVYRNIKRGDVKYEKVEMVSNQSNTIHDLFDMISMEGNHFPVIDSFITYHAPTNIEGKRNRFTDIRCYIPCDDERNHVYTINEDLIPLFNDRDLFGTNDGRIVFTKSKNERVAIAIFQMKGEQLDIMSKNVQSLINGLNILKGV